MKRYPLLVLAIVLVMSGILISPARSIDPYNETVTANTCLDSPFGRYIDGPGRDSFSILMAQPNGGSLLSDGGLAVGGNTQLGYDGADVYAADTAPSYGDQTGAQLAGNGRDSLITVAGEPNKQPVLTTQSWPASGGSTRTLLRVPEAATAAAVASGNFLGRTSNATWTADSLVTEPEQVAVVTRQPNFQYTLRIYKGITSGTALTATSAQRSWSPPHSVTQDLAWEDLQIAAVDVNGDLRDEVVVAYRKYDKLTIEVLGVNTAGTYISSITNFSISVGTPNSFVKHVRLVAGPFSQRFGAGVAIAYVVDNVFVGGNEIANLKTFGFDPNLNIYQTGSRTFSVTPSSGSKNPNFALAAGDTNVVVPPEGTGWKGYAAKDELVFARVYNGKVEVSTIDTGTTASLPTHNSYVEPGTYVSGAYQPYGLGVGAGDIDHDGVADIVLTYLNSGSSYLVWLKDRPQAGQGLMRLNGRQGNYGMYNLTNLRPLSVTMLDKTNATVRLALTITRTGFACRDYFDDKVASAGDAAPFWRGMMNFAKDYGTTWIGNSAGVESTEEASTTQDNNVEVTAGIGVGWSVDTPIWADAAGSEGSAIVSAIVQGAYSSGSSDLEEHTTWVSNGWWNSGEGTSFQAYRTPYRCYYYADPTLALQATGCQPLTDSGSPEPTLSMHNTEEWELDKITGRQAEDAWVPVRSPWTNRALLLPAGSTTQSGGGSSSALATDGNTDATKQATAATTISTPNPYWQVKLSKSEEIGLVRIYQGGGIDCLKLISCPKLLRDVNVFIFEDPTFADKSSAELMQLADEGQEIVVKQIPGTVGDVLNVVTRDAITRKGAVGQFVRVEKRTGVEASTLSLAEVEVYPADSYQAPPEYPRDVKYVSPTRMDVELWDPNSGQYVWKTMPGELLDLPSTSQIPWYQIGQGCGPHASWDYSRSTSTTETDTSSWTFGIGGSVEVEQEAKVMGADVIVQGKVEYTHDWEWEDSSSTTVGSQFAIGGWRSNYCAPSEVYPKPWEASMAAACEYKFRPFYYRTDEFSDWGRESSYLHVSYIVDMDRAKDLRNCFDGHWRNGSNQKPEVADLEVGTEAGHSVTIDVVDQAYDPNPEDTADYLQISGVASTADQGWKATATTGGGSVAVSNNKLDYTPAPGFTGTDTFFAMLSDGDMLSEPIKITVTVASQLRDGTCDTPAAWVTTGLAEVIGGSCRVRVSNTGAGSTLSQTFFVPETGGQQLTLRHIRLAAGDAPGDHLDVRIKPVGGSSATMDTYEGDAVGEILTNTYGLLGYQGQVVTITFDASGPAGGLPTEWQLDDLTIQ